MKRLFQIVLGTLLYCFFISNTANAQVTTASLNGQVVDSNGEPLIAATVVAVHVPTGTQYGTTTRDDGRFNLPNLRVGGPYKVTADYIGYQEQSFGGIRLALAQKLSLTFTLNSEAVTTEEEIVVIGKVDPILNNERTGAETNIGSDLLTSLPTITRSASDFTRLTPSSDGNSFAGRNDQFNNFSLDGSIFNNPFGLDAATPGGQTDAQPISLDAIDQIQVSLAPYDVTQAGFTGAAVNAVTKSGTNEFKGTVFGFWRNQALTGKKVDGADIVVPDLNQWQTGFSLGGPIIKDKLFFFVNTEIERRSDLGSNFIANRPGAEGANISRVEADDLELVRSVLAERFNYDTGEYEGYTHDTNNEKGIFKLDWNINTNHSLTATYNFLNAFKQRPAHPSALGRRGPDATTLQFENAGYRINNIVHSGLVEVRSVFGNKFSNKLQAGFTAFRDSRDPRSAPIPVININRDGIRYIVAGHEPFSINNRLDQDVIQISNNFNIYAGDHTITVGASFERFNFNNSFNLGVYDPFTYGGGTFGPGFESVQAFADSVTTGAFDDEFAFAQDVFATNTANDSWALAETNVGQFAFYAQDEIAITDNFNLTIGLRADMPLYFNTPELIQENIDRNCCFVPDVQYTDENGDPIVFDHTQLPSATPLISPRIGFNWDVTGDRVTQVRGGSGLFTGRLPFVWIGNQVANPNIFFYNVTDPDFKFPQVWRTNLGVDRNLGDGWIASLDVIYTRDINGMIVRNFGLDLPTGTLAGVDNRLIYTAEDRINNAYVFTNTDVGYSVNASFQIQKNFSNGLFASLAYNFLESKDASSIEAEISSDAFDRNPALGHVNDAVVAHSIYGNRHRVVGSAYKRFMYGGNRFATTVALFLQYQQGGRFSYTYSGDINNDSSPLNDLIYVPTVSELGDMAFTGNPIEQDAQRAAFNAFIEQDDYLSGRRGQYAEKYAILSPWTSNSDVRVLQDFNISVGDKIHTLQFSFDILNIGNLISSKWGVRQFPTNTQPVGVTVDPDTNVPTFSFDPSLQNTFSNDFGLVSRWQMQFGLRYIF